MEVLYRLKTQGTVGLVYDSQASSLLGLFPLNKSAGAESLGLLGEKDAGPVDKVGVGSAGQKALSISDFPQGIFLSPRAPAPPGHTPWSPELKGEGNMA